MFGPRLRGWRFVGAYCGSCGVEGEPVSQNLADAMATLIRLPSSQRGGAKRIF